MKMAKTNYLILLLLTLIFAAPGLAAYLYYHNPTWLLANTTNQGKLLNPALLFKPVIAGKSKWRLVFWQPGPCEKACLQTLDQLARIRLALGRHLYEVDEWLVLSAESQKIPRSLIQVLHENDIKVSRVARHSLKSFAFLKAGARVFIANPQGYLILAYQAKGRPQAIYHDIKQLLNTTKQVTPQVIPNAVRELPAVARDSAEHSPGSRGELPKQQSA
jgi:hypothetical protein